ncbi:MAG: hypothetical protein AAF591_22240 [Verrucomicrobiota bacterium]
MKKGILIHLIWLLVAAAAFAVGHYVLPPAPSDSADSNVIQRNIIQQNQGNSLLGNKDGSDNANGSGAGIGTIDPATGKRLLSKAEMHDAILAAIREPNLLTKNAMFAEILASISPDNIEDAVRAMREGNPGRDDFGQMRILTYAWGAMDPEAALAYTQEEITDNRGSTFTTMSVLSGWATEDPQGALAWLQGQEDLDGWELQAYERGIMSGFAEADPEAAAQYVLSLEDENQQRQYMDLITREQIQTKGLDEAKLWITNLPDGEAKIAAYDTVASQFARSDLDAAAEWAAGIAGDPQAVRAIAEVADELAERNPQEGLLWSLNLPAGDAQSQAIRATFSEWSREDPTGASEYLNTMAASPAKDQAVASFATSAAREDGEGGVAWATTIQDPQLREEATVRAAQAWNRQDSQAVAAWLPASGLSAESQQAVLNPQPRNDGRRDGPFGVFGGGGRGPGGGGGGRGPGGGGR